MMARYLAEEVDKWTKWLIDEHEKHLKAECEELRVAPLKNVKSESLTQFNISTEL